MRTPIIAWLTALAVGLAGCSSGGGGGGAEDTADESEPFASGNFTAGGNVTSGNSTVGSGASAEANTTAQWESENRSGSVSGVEVEVSGPSAEEEFTASAGGQELYLNITIEGDELDVYLRGPDCDEESCQQEISVSGGSGQEHLFGPAEGSYTVVLEPASIGPVDADYTIDFAVLVEADSTF